MSRVHVIVVCGTLLAAGCSRAPAPSTAAAANAAAPAAAPSEGGSSQAAGLAGTADAHALGEFDPLSQADVDLYLKVMRTAADRLAHLPPADRDALNAYRRMISAGSSDQPISTADASAMGRATELMSLDQSVAREMGVGPRYESIASRVEELMGPVADGGGDDPTTPEDRARLQALGDRLQQRDAKDAVAVRPHRAEILALQKKVNLVQHPESIPQ